jgi:hypothetical protein
MLKSEKNGHEVPTKCEGSFSSWDGAARLSRRRLVFSLVSMALVLTYVDGHTAVIALRGFNWFAHSCSLPGGIFSDRQKFPR